MNEQLINDLKASKAELQKRGWAKGNLINHSGSVCALGAIGCALVEDYEYNKGYDCFHRFGRPRKVVHALAKQLQPLVGYDEVDLIFHKNDSVGTTLQDVYDLFDKALAEEGGLA